MISASEYSWVEWRLIRVDGYEDGYLPAVARDYKLNGLTWQNKFYLNSMVLALGIDYKDLPLHVCVLDPVIKAIVKYRLGVGR